MEGNFVASSQNVKRFILLIFQYIHYLSPLKLPSNRCSNHVLLGYRKKEYKFPFYFTSKVHQYQNSENFSASITGLKLPNFEPIDKERMFNHKIKFQIKNNEAQRIIRNSIWRIHIVLFIGLIAELMYFLIDTTFMASEYDRQCYGQSSPVLKLSIDR